MIKRYFKAALAFLWLAPLNLLFFLFIIPMIPWLSFKGPSPAGGLAFVVSGPVKRFFIRRNIRAMCLGSWQLYIILDAGLVRHEDRHLKDECRFHVVYFLVYLVDYLVNLVLLRDAHKAYSEVVWEISARRAEKKVG